MAAKGPGPLTNSENKLPVAILVSTRISSCLSFPISTLIRLNQQHVSHPNNLVLFHPSTPTMKVIRAPLPEISIQDVPFTEDDSTDMAVDPILEDLGRAAEGYTTYENIYTPDPIQSSYRPFHDLAQGAHACLKYRTLAEIGEAKCHQAFAKLSLPMRKFLNHWDYFVVMDIQLDHDCHASKAELYLFDRKGHAPIDEWMFWDMSDAWDRCDTYENDFDFWGDELLAFRDMAESAVGHMSYEPPAYFPLFLQLPPELRVNVMHEYLLLESEKESLGGLQHYDVYWNRCCVWDYPEVLIACDNQEPAAFPPPETGRAPQGWLPALAFANKQMLGEVVVHMLERTERYDLKYEYREPRSKIATWFRRFLESIPNGQNAIKYLNFPHMSWFNHMCTPPAPTNPSVELMVACRRLRKVDMTFHASKLTLPDPGNAGHFLPRPVQDVITYFCLESIFQCENLEQVHFDGIHYQLRHGGRPGDLATLTELARWMKMGFLIERNGVKDVEIDVHERFGQWEGRTPGTVLVLSDEDLAEVERSIEAKRVGMCE
ncbi:hypothetical protein P153DRAFT_371694 [Dothidotthia symphoricarpi CBS 119687]|uniref:Uncharacterized protein n=1 Tax=Dothidotthia symphoricarpi CBS 119687 TaxID=1392245 RepID=A0A6A5ZYB9_9PLEO|nr:uncharacterized protein P153DRAFT_371694 [Dothidotthia symphoricarpi CBS 119687]KAF2123368.1 hypothetical protein P153DRAFT_371694 [Dothidotthia symphoricarpi CBS 119687]